MRVSIVTPSFNQANFLVRTAQSVLSQSGDFDLKWIVMDGGSDDGTVELLATPCPQPVGVAGAKGAPPVAGVAPLSEGAFVATCRSGAVLAVVGASSSGESRPQPL